MIAGRIHPTRSGGLGVYFRDVTTEKLKEMALQESEQRFRATFELTPIALAHVAGDGQWLRVNQGLSEIFRYSLDVLLAQKFQEAMRLADLELDLEQIKLALRGEVQSYEIEDAFAAGVANPPGVTLLSHSCAIRTKRRSTSS